LETVRTREKRQGNLDWNDRGEFDISGGEYRDPLQKLLDIEGDSQFR
jgi:hypothetical protein